MHHSKAKRFVEHRRLLAAMLAASLVSVISAKTDDQTVAFTRQGDQQQFGNASVNARWTLKDHVLTDMTVTDAINQQVLKVATPFALELGDGSKLATADFRLLSEPKVIKLKAEPKAPRLAERIPGKAIAASFGDADGRFRIDWQWVQREGSDYLREQVTITALKADENIKKVDLLQTQATGAEVVGTVNGSPIVTGQDYLGFEHPLSESAVRGKNLNLWIERGLPLIKGQSITYSAVIGATHKGQLRRDFLTYVERERAHPYRPFLHYNSWYDIGYFTPYTQQQAVDRINTFGQELSVKRGVKLDSFLFDDGWDDRSGSWNFSKDFPQGFVPVKQAAAKYGAAPGIWLSPWGGYSKPKDIRVENGKAQGYEIIDGGFALSGPKYYQRFHDVVMKLLKDDGINQFKFDGTGNADKVFPGSRFPSDFDAAVALIDDIREAKPGTFINLTTGTLPSPFWLRYADSIWRDGEDDDLTGVGTNREKWITYRDTQTYRNIVLKGPLYPLNSLMLHGIIYAQENRRLNTDPGHDFANEVHSYFGTGTQLQEMYITPSLLSDSDWDTLAESARWSRENADVLRDTHWIGGDPGRLDVYGWASWTPKKAIVTLRNPDARAQSMVIDLRRQLELPEGAATHFSGHSPWKADGSKSSITFDADKPTTIELQPFEVVTLELVPSV
ncbi:enterotoxin [Dyella sp. GSA-30]|uniref:enterotoxin n=1 Tax=Dyella sp. GSA-30 TaxID=2994496 RepID=UPI0024901059|nr:enterotoxin [Dyella sp. GSA-30]BDU20718.1 enterotoxin [Dyella sp. GSA-30]